MGFTCKEYAIRRWQSLTSELYIKTAVLNLSIAEFFGLGDIAKYANFAAMLQKNNAYQY
jgi:hypothetical protein